MYILTHPTIQVAMTGRLTLQPHLHHHQHSEEKDEAEEARAVARPNIIMMSGLRPDSEGRLKRFALFYNGIIQINIPITLMSSGMAPMTISGM